MQVAPLLEMDKVDHSSKYKLLEQVGNGSFGVVYKAVNKDTGEVVAIKEVCFLCPCVVTRGRSCL